MSYVTVEVDVHLSDIDDVDLLDELDSRGLLATTSEDVKSLVNQIYENQKLGKDIQPLLILLYDTVLGKVA